MVHARRKIDRAPQQSCLERAEWVFDIQGDWVDALIAEPAIDAFANRNDGGRIWIKGDVLDVFSSHPAISGVIKEDLPASVEQPRCIVVPSQAYRQSLKQRVLSVAKQLNVSLGRVQPRIFLSGADYFASARQTKRGKKGVLGLLYSDPTSSPARKRFWAELCHTLERSAAISTVSLLERCSTVCSQYGLPSTPRQIAAAASRCDLWISDNLSASLAAAAGGSSGIFIGDSDLLGDIFDNVALVSSDFIIKDLLAIIQNKLSENGVLVSV